MHVLCCCEKGAGKFIFSGLHTEYLASLLIPTWKCCSFFLVLLAFKRVKLHHFPPAGNKLLTDFFFFYDFYVCFIDSLWVQRNWQMTRKFLRREHRLVKVAANSQPWEWVTSAQGNLQLTGTLRIFFSPCTETFVPTLKSFSEWERGRLNSLNMVIYI